MNATKRKFNKLLKSPISFIRDSALLKPKNNTQQEKTEKPKQKKPEQNQLKYSSKAYIDISHIKNKTHREHIEKCFSDANCQIIEGRFRLDKNHVLVEINNQFFLFTLNIPLHNEKILKGVLLISNINNFTYTNEAEKLIHKINVSHMKITNDFNMLYYYYKDRPDCTPQSKAKYALCAGVYTKEIIDLSLSILLDKSLVLSQSDINLFFRKLYRVLGPSADLEQIADKLSSSIRKNIYPTNFIMLLSAFYNECGEYAKAIELAKLAKTKDSNAWRCNRYLALSNLLLKSGETDEKWARIDSENFIALQRNEWEFEQFARKNQIGVVGNSPIEIKTEKGKKINSIGKVIRFNGAVTDYPHSTDYGIKTDILVLNPRYFETQRNTKHNLDFIIVSDGNLYSTKDLSYKIHDFSSQAKRVCLIPRRIDISLTKKITSSPSSGLKTLVWLYSINGSINKDLLFGFSFTDQDHGVATSYVDGTRVGLNAIHNWSNEKKEFLSIIKNNQ